MNNIICNYDLEFIHSSRTSLMKLIKNYKGDIDISFIDIPKRQDGDYFFSIKANVSCEENSNFIFTDIIKDLVFKIQGLEIGGSFIDNLGRGYVNSLSEKQYTLGFAFCSFGNLVRNNKQASCRLQQLVTEIDSEIRKTSYKLESESGSRPKN